MTFDDMFSKGLPLEEAAAYFLMVKQAAPAYAEKVLPGTEGYHSERMLQMLNGLPAKTYTPEGVDYTTQLGTKLASDEEYETGKRRATASLAAKFEHHDHTRAERALEMVGRLGGGAGAGYAAHKHGKGGALSTVAAAALGQHLGGKAGKDVGGEADAYAYKKNHEKASAMLKRAFDELTGGAQGDISQYLAAEQAGSDGAEQAQSEFYKEKFQQASQEAQSKDQQIQGMQQQLDQVTQQSQQLQQTVDSSMQQAQQVQQQAMQSAQAAQAAATSAMQRTLASSNELIQQQGLTAQMRDSMQAMRQSLMQLAQQPPPPATTQEAGVESGAQDQQAPADAAAQPPQNPSQGGPPPEGAPPGGAPPAAAPPAEAPPQDASQGQPPAAPPPAAPPGGEQKMGSVSKEQLLGGALGALAGGGLGYAQQFSGGDDLKNKVKGLESKGDSRSFAESLSLAQSKARLGMADFSKQHPGASTAIGAGMGAVSGAAGGHFGKDVMNILGRGKK